MDAAGTGVDGLILSYRAGACYSCACLYLPFAPRLFDRIDRTQHYVETCGK